MERAETYEEIKREFWETAKELRAFFNSMAEIHKCYDQEGELENAIIEAEHI